MRSTSHHVRLPASAAVFTIALSIAAPRLHAAEPSAIERAKELFRQGEVDYRVGRFKEALAVFNEALKLVERPSIMLNIAQCHRQLGHEKKALFFYKLYMTTWQRQHPERDAPYQSEVQQHIADLERRQQKRRQEQQAKARERERQARLERQRQARLERQRQARLEASLAAQRRDEAQRETPFYKKWWFWTIVGAVAAGTATAIAVPLSQPGTADPVAGSVPPGTIEVE